MSAAELPLWRVVLDTGRLGDVVHVHAEDAVAAVKRLTRTNRKKVWYVRRVFKSSEIRALVASGEKPTFTTYGKDGLPLERGANAASVRQTKRRRS